MNRFKPGFVTVAFVVAFCAALISPAFGYFLGHGVSVEEMTTMADLVVKAKVIGDAPCQDAQLPPVEGYAVRATSLRVISVIKGKAEGDTIVFHHYADPVDISAFRENAPPQHYEFRVGRSYILFAKAAGAPGAFRPLWMSQTEDATEGVQLAADDKPVTQKLAKSVLWSELVQLTKSAAVADVMYGIHRLNEMSGGSHWSDSEFTRAAVAEVLRPLLKSQDASVLQAAIIAADSRNSLASGWAVQEWLAIGNSGNAGSAQKVENTTGRLLWHELAQLADSDASPQIRAAAILSLGRSGVPELPSLLERWAGDGSPPVRAAAIVLLGDVPAGPARLQISKAAHDPSPEVRRAAAYAIGACQTAALEPLLGNLLRDGQGEVRDAAAMSLLSFPPQISGDLLRANVHHADYRAPFVNALARQNPQLYLADLGEIISKNLAAPRNFSSSSSSCTSWNILYRYAQTRPAEEFKSGKLDAILGDLESAHWTGSSEPRDLYALYLQNGLNERAKAFRIRSDKTAAYDLDYYFKMADASPETYRRE